MKSKDLTVGMEVAVRVGHNIYRAWVLQKDTTWVELSGYSFLDSTRPDPLRVAIAFEAKWTKYLQRDVVSSAAILSTWPAYLVWKERETVTNTDSKGTKTAASRPEHCARVQQLADQIGVELQAVNDHKVVISFADLQRLTTKR